MTEDLRALAQSIFLKGVAAAEPEAITRDAVQKHIKTFGSRTVHIVATGKAAIPMMRGALQALLTPARNAIAVTNRGNLAELADVEVLPAGHPVPDADGAIAAQRVMEAVGSLTDDDVLLMLVSGGTSAMLPAPADGLSLEDEISATEGLLASGAPIDAVNAVRRRISRVKGGGLAEMAGEANIVTLMLSDVPGDDPAAIGSGPTIPANDDADDIEAIIRRYSLDKHLEPRLIGHLRKKTAIQAPRLGGERVAEVIGSNAISLGAVEAALKAAGYPVRVVSNWLDGDVAEAAEVFVGVASEASSGPIALIAGGETTVQLVGNGKGGRNQELALRFATLAQELAGDWVFLSGGTDGRDGPTDAAGGLVDQTSGDRIGAHCIQSALANNDAYHALEAGGDLLMTGGTGTNVADLQILLLK